MSAAKPPDKNSNSLFAARRKGGSKMASFLHGQRGTVLGADASQVINRAVKERAEQAAQGPQAARAPSKIFDGLTAKERRLLEHWGSTPVYDDQYTNPKYQGTFRLTTMQLSVFNLLVPEDLDRYNMIIAGTMPHEAPKHVVKNHKVIEGVSSTGAVATALVWWQAVVYRRDATMATFAEEATDKAETAAKNPSTTTPDEKAS